MEVVFLSPDYPTDLPLFVSGLAEVGARVSFSSSGGPGMATGIADDGLAGGPGGLVPR